MWRRASISTGVLQSRPEPWSETSWQSNIVKNSWSRRFTWSETRERRAEQFVEMLKNGETIHPRP